MADDASKDAIIGNLEVIRTRVARKVVELEAAGVSGAAATLATKRDALGDLIKALLARAIDAWLGDVDAAVSEMDDASQRAQDAIDAVEKDVGIAQNVVKAVGYIDDAIAIAKNAAKSM